MRKPRKLTPFLLDRRLEEHAYLLWAIRRPFPEEDIPRRLRDIETELGIETETIINVPPVNSQPPRQDHQPQLAA
jgi:hypothetical protein